MSQNLRSRWTISPEAATSLGLFKSSGGRSFHHPISSVGRRRLHSVFSAHAESGLLRRTTRSYTLTANRADEEPYMHLRCVILQTLSGQGHEDPPGIGTLRRNRRPNLSPPPDNTANKRLRVSELPMEFSPGLDPISSFLYSRIHLVESLPEDTRVAPLQTSRRRCRDSSGAADRKWSLG